MHNMAVELEVGLACNVVSLCIGSVAAQYTRAMFSAIDIRLR